MVNITMEMVPNQAKWMNIIHEANPNFGLNELNSIDTVQPS